MDGKVLLHGALRLLRGLFLPCEMHQHGEFMRELPPEVVRGFFFYQTTMSEATSRRIRAIFNVFNFWSIVLYNILFLNSLDFAKLVAKRLFLKGKCFSINVNSSLQIIF